MLIHFKEAYSYNYVAKTWSKPYEAALPLAEITSIKQIDATSFGNTRVNVQINRKKEQPIYAYDNIGDIVDRSGGIPT